MTVDGATLGRSARDRSTASDSPEPEARPSSARSGEPAAWHQPLPQTIAASQLTAFTRRLGEATGRRFDDHAALHDFSVAEFRRFWSLFLDWAELQWDGDATTVCTGDACECAIFFPDLRLNYAENVLAGRHADPQSVAVTSVQLGGARRSLTRAQLAAQVERTAQALRAFGIAEGDRVVAVMRNDADAVVAALAVAALGASLACANPEMGAPAIVERFQPLEPRLLLAHARTRDHDTGLPVAERIARVAAELPSLALVLTLDDAPLNVECARPVPVKMLSELLAAFGQGPFEWRRFGFNQALFIMASSGTTGRPKCIVHGAGGALIEHVKEHRLHCDLRSADRLYFQTSCAWMMWQWQLSALASCAQIVLYDGPMTDAHALWRIASDERVTVFGTSPAYLKFSQDAGVVPAREFDLGALRAILSTGAILYDSQYAWVRDNVGALPLQSISGGTDIIGCFVLGNPNLPIHAGESQCRSLGLDVRALPLEGKLAGHSSIGELVCANPFPSRPLGFFADDDGSRFHASYFAANPGVWTHGDLIEFSAQGGVRIHGRSDGVLKVRGIRIGPAEIYRIVREFSEVRDAMAVEQRVPAEYREGRALLFLVLDEGVLLDAPLELRIRRRLAQAASASHVPDAIVQVAELPYTHSGKPSEAALTAAVNGLPVCNAHALRNPGCLEGVAGLPQLRPPPADEVDAALAGTDPQRCLRRLWERSFGFAPIGLDDDYFEMGGHSLQAARLLADIGRAFGRELPLATLLHAPTIRHLAELLVDPSRTPAARLIPLRAGEGRPFFLVHSMAGTLLEMWAVVRALTGSRPVYGLQARGLEDGQELHLSVPDMAREYIGLMRELQPLGPYAIGGYSFGGLVAFEIASQLGQAGETVEAVTLIDAQIDGRFLPTRQRCADLVRRLAERTQLFRSLGARQRWAYLVAKSLVFFDRCRQVLGLEPGHPELVGNIVVEAQHPVPLRRIRGAMHIATRAYRPPTYTGRVIYIRPQQPGDTDSLPVWRRAVRGQLVVETAPGDHASVITGTNAVTLAGLISRHLATPDGCCSRQ